MSLIFCNGKTPMVVSNLNNQNMACREVAKFCEENDLDFKGNATKGERVKCQRIVKFAESSLQIMT